MIGFEWVTCMSQRRRAVELGTNLPTLLTGAAISLLTLKIAIVGLWDAFNHHQFDIWDLYYHVLSVNKYLHFVMVNQLLVC